MSTNTHPLGLTMKNSAWMVSLVPLYASTATLLEALLTLPLALTLYGLGLLVHNKNARVIAGLSWLCVYELALKVVSFAAFSDLQSLSPLWLVLALIPVKPLKPSALACLIGTALAIASLRELAAHGVLFSQAYLWFGLAAEPPILMRAPWLNETAVLMLLLGLAVAAYRSKGCRK